MLRLFSADDHIIEHARVWQDRVPAKFRETAPRVIEEDGREYWLYAGMRGETMGLNAVVGRPRDQVNLDPLRFSDMRPGCYDPAERAKDMLSDGIFASVLFPTLPRFSGTLFLRGETGFSIEQVPWHKETYYRLPISVWREAMDVHFPGSGWLRLRVETIDALLRVKSRLGLPTWDETLDALLVQAGERGVNGGRPVATEPVPEVGP